MTTKKMITAITAAAGMALTAASANAANITEDFEGGPGVPAGWSLVNQDGNGTYNTGPTGNGGGNAGNFAWTGTTQNAPGVYLVNSGVAFDATKAISGSFDFLVGPGGNDDRASFLMGDIQNGLSNAAGEYLHFFGNERTFGRRARLLDGAGNVLFNGDGDNTFRIDENIWISADFTWTPTSGTTGDFTITWDGPSPTGANRGPMTVIGYTFDSNEVFFAFGTGRQNSPMQVDNINITGELVPEPASLALLGLGGLLIARRK